MSRDDWNNDPEDTPAPFVPARPADRTYGAGWNTYGLDSFWDAGNVVNPYHEQGLIAPGIRDKLRELGYSGPLTTNGSIERYTQDPGNRDRGNEFNGTNKSYATQSGSQELVDWLKSKRLSIQSQSSNQGGDTAKIESRIIDTSGNTVGYDGYDDGKSNWQKIAPSIAIGGLAAMTGGALAPLAAGAFGTGTALAGAATGAGAGAVGGGLNAAYNDQNILSGALRGAALGGVTGGVANSIGGFNPAQSLGIENELGQNVVNGGIKGGVSAALRGENVLTGALGGAAMPALGALGDAASSFFSPDVELGNTGIAGLDKSFTELQTPSWDQAIMQDIAPDYHDMYGNFVTGRPLEPDYGALTRPAYDFNDESPKFTKYDPTYSPDVSAGGVPNTFLKDLLKSAPGLISGALKGYNGGGSAQGGGSGGSLLDLGTIKRGGIADALHSPLAAVDTAATWQPAGISAALRQKV
jgi:hypothetical protein